MKRLQMTVRKMMSNSDCDPEQFSLISGCLLVHCPASRNSPRPNVDVRLVLGSQTGKQAVCVAV